jgi:hypothetical protein
LIEKAVKTIAEARRERRRIDRGTARPFTFGGW